LKSAVLGAQLPAHLIEIFATDGHRLTLFLDADFAGCAAFCHKAHRAHREFLLQQVHSANGLLLKALSCARNTFLCSASLLFTTAQ
jgi:hypothetical protein